ncbi:MULTISPECIES: hypothetical protein [unclassified Crossiella]|uniref:hypothetical protein n=1 Tax=unclassified Crossiella TaxID=2620835 RepID=UPI001FFFF356|nr:MULTISPECIES: hypothetical protein [unclassified Crossiella]MCK2240029.1 hypothetical protein [Crossiella sp. S99.2]MCK2252737.1 hypothetical protein [Crossiella sp. S99.1]
MPTIKQDATISRKRTTPSGGLLTPRGHIHINATALHGLLGTQHPGGHPGRWILDTPAGTVQLRGSPSHCPHTSSTWTVDASGDEVFPWLHKALLGTTAGFSLNAEHGHRDADRAGYAQAYASYLYLRYRADQQRAKTTPRGTREHRLLEVRLHLHSRLAEAVRNLVLHESWRRASTHERVEWARTPRPLAKPGTPVIDHWQARTRWSFDPEYTPGRGLDGETDLETTLLWNAELQQRASILRGDEPDGARHLLVLEYATTLRQLATATFPLSVNDSTLEPPLDRQPAEADTATAGAR